MKKTHRHISLVIGSVFLFAGQIAGAQDVQELLREWMEGQRSVIENIGSLVVSESVEHVMDAGFGEERLIIDAVRTIGSEAESPGREIVGLTVNGEDVPADAGNRMRRLRALMRPEMGRLLDGFRFPVQEVARMAPPRRFQEEERDGTVLYRIDLSARERRGPIERITLWFNPDTAELVSTFALMRGPGGTSVQIRASYSRIDGIDVPIEREIEGTVPIRRRMRMFTMLFDQRVSFSDYDISFKD